MKNLLISLFTAIIITACQEAPTFEGFTYPDGRYKALILSYDDGAIDDIRLSALFDEHHLVGTFNLNSGYLGVTRGWPQENGDTIYQKYVPRDSLLIIYKNHEIAAHGELHKNFPDITDEEILQEVNADLKQLQELTKREVISLAYPFGNANEKIARLVGSTGILNGRTIADTHAYGFPENDLLWHPTCHDSRVLEHLDPYLELDQKDLSLLYVWGHSWEFGDPERWNNMVEFCKRMGAAEGIWSVGHGEFTRYRNALKHVQVEEGLITNPADNGEVWIRLSTGTQRLKSGEAIQVKSR